MAASRLADLSIEIGRVSDRLRAMSDVRLGQSLGDGETRAAAARRLAQELADAAQGIEQRAHVNPRDSRVVPDLGVFAVGDQVAVTGADLVRAAKALPGGAEVWRGGTRARLDDVIAEQAEAVRLLRLTL